MATYVFPEVETPSPVAPNEALLIASGDLRQSANEICWPAQAAMEAKLTAAFAAEGVTLRRAHPYDEARHHGFISSQRMGMDIFAHIPADAPLVVAESVWQYSANVLSGLLSHRGPILTVANWSGLWPGLVGMLNLNACLRKTGVKFTTLWSKDFTDELFLRGLRTWIQEKSFTHDTSHVHPFNPACAGAAERRLGEALATELQAKRAILGVFDEGCMGMANAILEDGLLNPCGIFKERLSQSALYAAMKEVTDAEAQQVRNWLDAAGVKFHTGPNPETDLTDGQLLDQFRMYIAVLRFADEFGCDVVGIQYQQGLKDTCPASDLAEGLLNNVDRPPAYSKDGREIFPGLPLPHFNEADEGAGVDMLTTNRVWRAMGLDPATTLHDVRWGEHYKGESIDDFVWLFQISGAVPASHLTGGYKGADSFRQQPMYFRLGGGTLCGVCRPGELVWSRVFVENGKLKADLGRATCVKLPEAEIERRWAEVSREWPVQHVVLHGVTQNQFMARHAANHVCVVYAPDAATANRALAAKASMLAAMGLEVSLCGVTL